MEQAGSLGHQADRVLSAGDAGQRSGSDRVQRRARWARPRSSRPGVVRLGHPRRGGTLTLVRIRVSGTAERASRRPLQLPRPDTLHLGTQGDEEKQHMSPGADIVKKQRRSAMRRALLAGEVHQHANAPHHIGLCARRERPHRRAAEQRDERAPRHSITSSASASSRSGTSMPSAFAVLRLITNSNFVDICSPGNPSFFRDLIKRTPYSN
jgi:hypothetical protein